MFLITSGKLIFHRNNQNSGEGNEKRFQLVDRNYRLGLQI